MSNLELPEDFQNTVAVFPLPNLVLFPGIIQGLHIFEPRYRQMTEDALRGDHLIALALLKPPYAAENLFSTVCIGKIVAEVKLEDGRFNILLAGIRRAKIVKELPSDKMYRLVRVSLQDDVKQLSSQQSDQLKLKLVDSFQRLASIKSGILQEVISAASLPEIPLSRLLDLIAYGCGAPPTVQQQVLEQIDLEKRAEIVMNILAQQLSAANSEDEDRKPFPPDFSIN